MGEVYFYLVSRTGQPASSFCCSLGVRSDPGHAGTAGCHASQSLSGGGGGGGRWVHPSSVGAKHGTGRPLARRALEAALPAAPPRPATSRQIDRRAALRALRAQLQAESAAPLASSRAGIPGGEVGRGDGPAGWPAQGREVSWVTERQPSRRNVLLKRSRYVHRLPCSGNFTGRVAFNPLFHCAFGSCMKRVYLSHLLSVHDIGLCGLRGLTWLTWAKINRVRSLNSYVVSFDHRGQHSNML